MSIALMTAVWRMEMSATDKIVLLALADAANDDGVTWMAVKSRREGKLDLIIKTSLSERAVQMAIKRLCDGGFLDRVERPGKGVVYTILTPGFDAPPHEMRPARNAKTPARDAPKPSVTARSGSYEPSLSARNPTDEFEAFWKLYPRKKAKPQALKAYVSARKKTDHATIVAGLSAQISWGVFAEPKFSPHPATWLNAGRWSDERDAEGSAGVAGRQGAGRGGSRPSGIIGAIARSRAARGEGVEIPGGEASLFGEQHDWREGAIEGECRSSDQPDRNGHDAVQPAGRGGYDRPAVGRYRDAD